MRRISLKLSIASLSFTIILIIVLFSVFQSLTKPDLLYNNLIYQINRETSSDVKFYRMYCYPEFKNTYNLSQDTEASDKYLMCKSLYQELSIIPILNSKGMNKQLKQYQLSQFNYKLSLLYGPEQNCCQDGQSFICKKSVESDYTGIQLPPVCSKDPKKYTTIISDELLGKINIYTNLGLI